MGLVGAGAGAGGGVGRVGVSRRARPSVIVGNHSLLQSRDHFGQRHASPITGSGRFRSVEHAQSVHFC